MSNNFQNGFVNSITVRGIPLSQAYPGEVFYVSNSSVLAKGARGGSDSNDGSRLSPFATIDYAIGRTTASRGDIIAVLPGHAETLTAAGDIALDVAGVALVGLGSGTLRPQITLGAAAGSAIISAANTAVVGIDFIAGFALIVNAISITAAGTGASIENCNFTESGADLDYVNVVVITTLAHDISFINNTFEMGDVLAVSMIAGTVHDRLHIEDCRFNLQVAQTSLVALITGTDITSGLIKNCTFTNPKDGALFIGFSGTCTGIMRDCTFSSLDVAGAISDGFVNSGFLALNCWVSGEANGWGILGGGNAAYS